MPAGRPRAFTPEKKQEVYASLRLGTSRTVACDYVEIDYSTLTREEKRDPDFAIGLKKAEAEGQMFHLKRVREGKNGWQASAWMLERKWYKEFSKAAWDQTKDGESIADILKNLIKPNNANAGDTPTSDK